MSEIAISYDDLEDSAKIAKKVSEFCDAYGDELSKVLNSITHYKGNRTVYVTGAMNTIRDKIVYLEEKKDRFSDYSKALNNLIETCKIYDSEVEKDVSRLTGDFCRANGIGTTVVENFVIENVTRFFNSTAAGRFLSNGIDRIAAGASFLKDCIENWYNFGFGKACINNILSAYKDYLPSIVVMGLTIVRLIFNHNGASDYFDAVSVSQGFTFDTFDFFTSVVNTIRASYHSVNPEDAALTYRLLNEGSFIDVLRHGDIVDEDDSSWFNQAYKGRAFWADFCDWQYILGDLAGLIGSFLDIGRGDSASPFIKGISEAKKYIGCFDEARKDINEAFSDTDSTLGEKLHQSGNIFLDFFQYGGFSQFFDIIDRYDSIYKDGKDSFLGKVPGSRPEPILRVIRDIRDFDI